MKKSLKILTVALSAATIVLSFPACGHDHVWSDWQRNADEHWRTCTVEGCNVEERDYHTEGRCEDCAYGFKVLSFGFDEGGDTAHSDFAKEANVWFPQQGELLGFTYDFVGTDFSYLNDETLAEYDLVMFLNSRPFNYDQQAAFERYMENGGAWMGFHSCAFSMDGNNEYWTWYQSDFLGCGQYARNTWNPTSEPLTVETHYHCSTENIEVDVFTSAPCEWYGWELDLFADEDISVLLTLNPTNENPAGDQPDPNKQYEIWYNGTHPVAWTNNNYNMVYMNWGHNLQSYNNGAEGKQSSTFSSEIQNQFMLDAMYGLVLGER
ncbi:MAG: ThuA domain-containing protein [Clostridiales bacterium]|nr:ThuA domain-containing protein [Clostridiales bacterium]